MTGSRVMVTGAGGYVGSRLVPELLRRGHHVVAGATRPDRTRRHPWGGDVDVVHCDVMDPDSVAAALTSETGPVDAVVYLVHRMSATEEFDREDAEGAACVRDAMAVAGVGRCVYLSGLAPTLDGRRPLSRHMASRSEVEDVLAAGPTPVCTLRAGVVVGAGSTSFEVLRALCELLPVQPVPRWMRRQVEPVAEVDVVEALCRAVEGEPRRGSVDLGCGEAVPYPELLRRYSRVARLPTLRVPVPPVPWELVAAGLVRVVEQDPQTVAAMIESLRHDMVCSDRSAAEELMPDGWRWTGLDEALRSAVQAGAAARPRGARPRTGVRR